MIIAWNPEFEKMWRARLSAMADMNEPFRPFIEKISELEINDAFVLALNEIESLRQQLAEARARADLSEHQVGCSAHSIGGIYCMKCDLLKKATEAAQAEKEKAKG